MTILHKRELDLKQIFRNLLCLLLLSDTICILFTISVFALPQISYFYATNIFPHLIPVLLPLAQISLTVSIYATIGVAVERFVSVCSPHTKVFSLLSCFLLSSSVSFASVRCLANPDFSFYSSSSLSPS